MIDISSVPELKGCIYDQNLIVGVGITLTELLNVFKAVAKREYFGYLEKFVEHISLVASIPIRNVSWLDNCLGLCHNQREIKLDTKMVQLSHSHDEM